jgi:hypothetical protein
MSSSKTSSKKSKATRKTKRASPSPKFVIDVQDNGPYITYLRDFIKKKVYRVEYELSHSNRCVNYIDNGSNHVVFQNKDGQYVMFHLENKPDPKIIEKCSAALAKKKRSLKNTDLMKDAILLARCVPDVDLSDAQAVLHELNKKLVTKCPGLHLKLAPFHEFEEPMSRYNEHGHVCVGCNYYETLILALCNSKKCISTIELIPAPGSSSGEILINSKTDGESEGKKYNKMLRAVMSMILEKIPGANYIKSTALNPISTWLLLKYSKATIESGDPFEAYLRKHHVTLSNITQDIIKEYYSSGSPGKKVYLIVHLNHANSESAKSEFDALVAGTNPDSEIKC